MKKNFIIAGLAIAMSAQVANAQSWYPSSSKLLSARNNLNKSDAYVGIGVNATTNYRLDVLGKVSIGATSTTSSSGGSLIIKPADSQVPLTVMTSSRANALKVWNNGAVTIGSSTLQPSGNGLIVSGNETVNGTTYLAKTLKVAGATTLNTTLNVSGASTLTGNVGVGAASNSNYKLYVNGSTFLKGNTKVQVPSTYFSVLTDNNASEIQMLSMKNESASNAMTNTLYSYQCASQYSCGAANLAFKAKNFYFNTGDMYVAKNVDVKGKITCHNEIEVTAMNAGSINAKDINVELPAAADYVFEEDYNLKSLSEVEAYVKENKHLPGMPSASEFAENGMSVSAMSNKLLEKVEELTLHMIKLEKENQALKAKIEELSK